MIDFTFKAVLVLVMALHIFNTPYTKVEESFNIQAVHDILYHGNNLSKYDHNEFPGVVPRSFVGPLALSAFCYPAVMIINYLNFPKLYSQFVCRFVLGFVVCLALLKLSKNLSKKKSNLFILFTVSQFHLMYYSSRTLPNIFALVIVLYAISSWLENKNTEFIWYSAFVIIIFRAELAMFLGVLLLVKLFERKIKFFQLIKHCLIAGPAALGLTVSVDSYFWQRWLWPEGEVFYYNTLLNKSSNWGTEPFLWYFYSAIPRSLLLTYGFLPLFIATNLPNNLKQLFYAALMYVFMYSFLPHKESRFIIYVYPVFNMVAADVASNLMHSRIASYYRKLSIFFMCCLVVGNFCLTMVFSIVSSFNYPGGDAFRKFHIINQNKDNLFVHITNAAAQTGVTRFGELFTTWKYSKDEQFDWFKRNNSNYSFTHVIIESPCNRDNHSIQAVIYSYKKLSLSKSFPFLSILLDSSLCILET
ncbi:dol-P-Man:Man(7)GlcNAc(2)-PP-Dol alpha-1,6-mannosyltransferase isoform X2 [Hydra vulgaris]|nr:dol-P-Man:Man(7)GlcNAc(2)-PP-Dol alpha-1,6-mannosyltransferase [Hydra vulgaris]